VAQQIHAATHTVRTLHRLMRPTSLHSFMTEGVILSDEKFEFVGGCMMMTDMQRRASETFMIAGCWKTITTCSRVQWLNCKCSGWKK